MIEPTLYDHILFGLFLIVLPLFAVLQGQPKAKGVELDTPAKIATYWANSVVLWIGAGAVAFVWARSDRAFADLGLRAPRTDGLPWAVGLVLVLLGLYALDVYSKTSTAQRLAETKRRWRRDTPFMPETGRELAHSLSMLVSAAVCEEVLFRGYAISYLTAFTGTSVLGLTLAVAVPALIFAVSHLYQGWSAVFRIVLMALLFGAVFLITGSLWILIAVHFVVDAGASILGLRLMRDDETTTRNEPS